LLAVSPGPGRGRKPVYVPAKDGVGYARKGGALPPFSAIEKGGYLTEKRGVSYGEKGGAPESFVQQSQGLRPPTSDNLCIPLMKQARKESDSVTVKEQNRTPERGFAPKEGKKEKGSFPSGVKPYPAKSMADVPRTAAPPGVARVTILSSNRFLMGMLEQYEDATGERFQRAGRSGNALVPPDKWQSIWETMMKPATETAAIVTITEIPKTRH